jgi:hypothetical protein
VPVRFHDFVNLKARICSDCEHHLAAADATSSLPHSSREEQKARVRRELADLKHTSNVDVLIQWLRREFDHQIDPGQWRDKIIGDLAREQIGASSEYEWYHTERPFYNVYPVIEKLIHNTKLDLSAAFLNLPYRTMLFRFAAGHEPYGIQTVLLTIGQPHVRLHNAYERFRDGRVLYASVIGSAMVQYLQPVDDWHKHEVYTLAPFFASEEPTARPYEPRFLTNMSEEARQEWSKYQILQIPDGVALQSITSTPVLQPHNPQKICELRRALLPLSLSIALQWDAQRVPSSLLTFMGYNKSLDVHQFVFKLALFASMLHKDPKMIEPVVLAKHQERYSTADEAMKKWLEDKASQIQGRGFSIGKELNARADISPHLRNAHMALFWTGPGRKEPLFKLRAGCRVNVKHIAEVPTGFLGEEKPNEATPRPASTDEYVYFLHDPAKEYIKIGRSARSIESRQKTSRTWVPGGLKLLGYIVTGDCVALETRIHREQAAKRLNPGKDEFFTISVDEAKAIINQFGGVIAPTKENE